MRTLAHIFSSPTCPRPTPSSTHRAHVVIGYVLDTVYVDRPTYVTVTVETEKIDIDVKIRDFGVKNRDFGVKTRYFST